MSSLLERQIASVERRLVVLAPPHVPLPAVFRQVSVDWSTRAELLAEVQRLRGSVYVADGALDPMQLTADGRHVTPEDDKAWHIITRDRAGNVTACSWYLEHRCARSVQDLRASTCTLHQESAWSDRFHAAVRAEISTAARSGIPFAEVGGWAVAPEHRCSSEGLTHVFAMFGLSLALGGAIGLATATVRHSSAAILRRTGMAPLALDGEAVPTYYDPNYQCDMEVLRFDTRSPSRKYAGVVGMLRDRLAEVPMFGHRRETRSVFAAPAAPVFEPAA